MFTFPELCLEMPLSNDENKRIEDDISTMASLITEIKDKNFIDLLKVYSRSREEEDIAPQGYISIKGEDLKTNPKPNTRKLL